MRPTCFLLRLLLTTCLRVDRRAPFQATINHHALDSLAVSSGGEDWVVLGVRRNQRRAGRLATARKMAGVQP
jgi:hypothetical protein